MAKNGNNNKHTRHNSRRMNVVINGEECNFHNTVWCKGGMKLADIGTKNVRGDKFNPILGYAMVILNNL